MHDVPAGPMVKAEFSLHSAHMHTLTLHPRYYDQNGVLQQTATPPNAANFDTYVTAQRNVRMGVSMNMNAWSQGKLQFLTSPFEEGVGLQNEDPLFNIVYTTTAELRQRLHARFKFKKIAHWTSSTGSSLAADEATTSFVSLLQGTFDFTVTSTYPYPSADRRLQSQVARSRLSQAIQPHRNLQSCSCPLSYPYFSFSDSSGNGGTHSCGSSGVWGDLTGDGTLSPEDVQIYNNLIAYSANLVTGSCCSATIGVASDMCDRRQAMLNLDHGTPAQNKGLNFGDANLIANVVNGVYGLLQSWSHRFEGGELLLEATVYSPSSSLLNGTDVIFEINVREGNAAHLSATTGTHLAGQDLGEGVNQTSHFFVKSIQQGASAGNFTASLAGIPSLGSVTVAILVRQRDAQGTGYNPAFESASPSKLAYSYTVLQSYAQRLAPPETVAPTGTAFTGKSLAGLLDSSLSAVTPSTPPHLLPAAPAPLSQPPHSSPSSTPPTMPAPPSQPHHFPTSPSYSQLLPVPPLLALLPLPPASPTLPTSPAPQGETLADRSSLALIVLREGGSVVEAFSLVATFLLAVVLLLLARCYTSARFVRASRGFHRIKLKLYMRPPVEIQLKSLCDLQNSK